MGLDLEKIRQRLAVASLKGGSSNSVFWKIPEGESVVRIVAPSTGDPFVEAHQHYNVGKNTPFLCPKKQFGEECPVCAYVSSLYKSKNEEDIAMAKKLVAKARYFSPVLVRGEESEGIRWWSYSKTVYLKLLKVVNKTEEYGDITDPEQGTDLVIEYSTPVGASFPKTDFEVRRKTSPLCKDLAPEKCKEMIDGISDVFKALAKKSTADIKMMLDEWILGKDDVEGGAEVNQEVEKYGKGAPVEKSPKKQEKQDTTEEGSAIDAAFKELLED